MRIAGRCCRRRGARSRCDGDDLAGWPIEERVARGMAWCPRGASCSASMTVEDNLLLGGYRALQGGERDCGDQLRRGLPLFPRLQERRTQLAGTLSGGERQMLAVGRALMAKPGC